MDKLLYGVGLNDYDSKINVNGKILKFYKVWQSMLSRCYDFKCHSRYPAYIGCSVCKEWHSLTAFKKWFDENYIEGYELDKDILVEGNRIYSPETCCFVPKEINRLFENRSKRLYYDKQLPIGIQFDKYRGKYLAEITINGKRKYVGRFNTINEAYECREIEKRYLISKFIEEYYRSNKITKKVYEAIKNRI